MTLKQYIQQTYPDYTVVRCNKYAIELRDDNGLQFICTYETEQRLKNENKTPKQRKQASGLLAQLKQLLGGARYYIDKRADGYRIKLSRFKSVDKRALKRICTAHGLELEIITTNSYYLPQAYVIRTPKAPKLM